MRHNVECPAIISPRQRVPELALIIDRNKLVNFIEENQPLIADFLNIYRLPTGNLMQHVSHEHLVLLNGFPEEYRRLQMAHEVADRAWTQHIKPKLIPVVYDDLVEQAISYTHDDHLKEVPFENGKESIDRLKNLVAEAISLDKILANTVQMQLKPTYQIIPEDLQPYLSRVYTETVRDIYAALHDLEHPMVVALHGHFFNDTAPTKFSIDMVERFHQGKCSNDEIVKWALERPDFWMPELLGICNRNIDRDPNVSPDEKVTQKAAVYQLLKSLFLGETEEN